MKTLGTILAHASLPLIMFACNRQDLSSTNQAPAQPGVPPPGTGQPPSVLINPQPAFPSAPKNEPEFLRQNPIASGGEPPPDHRVDIRSELAKEKTSKLIELSDNKEKNRQYRGGMSEAQSKVNPPGMAPQHP